MADKEYQLPRLKYEYGDLAPYISEKQLQIHHDKHHLAYVSGANAILKKLKELRASGADMDIKALMKELSFNIGGHVLHFLFWDNLAPEGKGGGGEPTGILADEIIKEFGSFEQFKKEFSKAALTAEGSGWACLTYCMQTAKPIIMQVEKHNTNVYPMFRILMALDVWEHAYYLDYQNNRAGFIESFWKIVDWETVNKRLEILLAK